jgi:hypothetical protein
MAALDFPSSPTTGQTFFSNGYGWQYNGTSWVPISVGSSFTSFPAGTLDGGGATSTTTSLTSPSTETGITPVWYGGTGAASIPAGLVIVGNGTNPVTTASMYSSSPAIAFNSQPAGYGQTTSFALI